jgi:acyl-coenzyme A thioesterase PaaI-like protein
MTRTDTDADPPATPGRRDTTGLIRRCMDDRRPMSPSHGAARVRFTEVERGSVCAQGDIAAFAPRASLLILADAALGAAVTTAFPHPGRVATLQMAIHFVTAEVEGSVAVARARAVSTSENAGVSTGEILDRAGRLIAVMSTRCALVHAQRPPQALQDSGEHAERRLALAGDYEGEDTQTLLGLQRATVADGHALWSAVASDGLGNLGGAVQGGALAAIGAIALENLFDGTDSEGYDLIVDYRRSIVADGGRITAEASIDHDGRRLGLGTCLIRDDRGREAAIARISRFDADSAAHHPGPPR